MSAKRTPSFSILHSAFSIFSLKLQFTAWLSYPDKHIRFFQKTVPIIHQFHRNVNPRKPAPDFLSKRQRRVPKREPAGGFFGFQGTNTRFMAMILPFSMVTVVL